MKKITISSSVLLSTGLETDTSIFIHGDDLWRMQKTNYEYSNGQRGSFVSKESVDFTKSQFRDFFPALFIKAQKVIDDEIQIKNLAYSRPFFEDVIGSLEIEEIN